MSRPKDSVASILNPVDGFRGQLKKSGIEPKNHMKDNARSIKQTEESIRLRKAQEEEDAAKQPFKLKQFQDVPSVVQARTTQVVSQPEGQQTKEFLRAHTKKVEPPPLTPDELKKFERRASFKEPVPRDSGKLLPRTNKDFVRENVHEATNSRSIVPTSVKERDALPTAKEANPEFGKVPAYLQERRETERKRAEEERIRTETERDCPSGMILMSEEDRVKTLGVLNDNLAQVSRDLSRLPFIIDTPSLTRKKQDLESKLSEIEDAIKLFSKPKVYVAATQ